MLISEYYIILRSIWEELDFMSDLFKIIEVNVEISVFLKVFEK